MPGTGRRRAAAAAACGVGPAQGPALSQAEVPALSSGPRELARPGTRVLRPACQKAEGVVGLCTDRRATHMEPLSNPEKGVPSSLQGQPASAGAGQRTAHTQTVAPKDGTVSGRKGLGEGWRRPPRLAWGGLGLCAPAIACLPHQTLCCMEARSPAPCECLGCSRCQIYTRKVIPEFKCRA